MILENDRYTYRVTWSEEDAAYVGLCAEFPSLSWLADSPEEALQGIRQVVGEVVADMIANQEAVPEPLANRQFSGKFLLRIPPELHRHLALEAAEAGISLNRLASDKLARRDTPESGCVLGNCPGCPCKISRLAIKSHQHVRNPQNRFFSTTWYFSQ